MVPVHDVFRVQSASVKSARAEVIIVLHKFFLRVRDEYSVPLESNLDTLSSRSFEEYLYEVNLATGFQWLT